MKIVLIGPGIMPIPPTGWGAVEILVWDTKIALEKLGQLGSNVTLESQDEPSHVHLVIAKVGTGFPSQSTIVIFWTKLNDMFAVVGGIGGWLRTP